MRPGRIVSLVVGSLLILPALALLIGGGALGVAYAVGRDDDGYFAATLDRLETETVAITAEDIAFAAEPGSPDWILDSIDADVRLRVTGADATRDVFVGIGPEADVDVWLDGVAHDRVVEIDDGFEPVYRRRAGGTTVAPPIEQDFWAASATGPGTQELEWEAESGRWSVVVMNADASPGVAADVNVGVRAGFLLPLAFVLLGVGAVLTAVAVVLIVVGATGRPPRDDTVAGARPADTGEPIRAGVEPTRHPPSPVRLDAMIDPGLSRWQWLVKWFLAIPHFIVLAFLWTAFVVLTFVAGVAILFTGRYPRGIFDFNLGVLRWSWRVAFYATTGGLGTDRYPPFSLGEEPDYPVTLTIDRPERLSRGLVLVKWWLLAIPHYLVLGVVLGSFTWVSTSDGAEAVGTGGLLGILSIIAAVTLLVRGRYPAGLFDLIVGLNRWVARVVAYAALMTDTYPPFRLDQGGADQPVPLPPPVGPRAGSGATMGEQPPPPSPSTPDAPADDATVDVRDSVGGRRGS